MATTAATSKLNARLYQSVFVILNYFIDAVKKKMLDYLRIKIEQDIEQERKSIQYVNRANRRTNFLFRLMTAHPYDNYRNENTGKLPSAHAFVQILEREGRYLSISFLL